jgi:hypothetical protein
MFNGPKIKKERDQLLVSNEVKDVMYENLVESSKAELLCKLKQTGLGRSTI